MTRPRTMLLFDPKAVPQSWNERLTAGEYAVLYSSQQLVSAEVAEGMNGGPFCSVFATLAEAEAHAKREVELHPALRCRIYDHHGLGKEPVQEIHGTEHEKEGEMSPRFRRWCGGILFVGGLALVGYDWTKDFNLGWPATIGMRLFPAGLILLVTEAVMVWDARRKAARKSQMQ